MQIKNKVNLMIHLVLVCGFVTLSSCHARPIEKHPDLRGYFDGESYTSPWGSLTIYLNEIGEIKSLRDQLDEENARENFSFTDKNGNFYGIVATHVSEPVPNDFLEQMRRKDPDFNKESRPMKTLDGTDCLAASFLQEDANTGKGSAKAKILFAKQKTIFEIIIITKQSNTPQAAGDEMDTACIRLWGIAVFRDLPLPHRNSGQDPRIFILLKVAERAARETQLDFVLPESKEEKSCTIYHLKNKNVLSLRLVFSSRGETLLYNEELKYKPENQQMAEKIRETFIVVFERMLAEERLSVQKK